MSFLISLRTKCSTGNQFGLPLFHVSSLPPIKRICIGAKRSTTESASVASFIAGTASRSAITSLLTLTIESGAQWAAATNARLNKETHSTRGNVGIENLHVESSLTNLEIQYSLS